MLTQIFVTIWHHQVTMSWYFPLYPSLWKTKDLSYFIKIMTVYGLALQVANASAALLFTCFTQNNQVPHHGKRWSLSVTFSRCSYIYHLHWYVSCCITLCLYVFHTPFTTHSQICFGMSDIILQLLFTNGILVLVSIFSLVHLGAVSIRRLSFQVGGFPC